MYNTALLCSRVEQCTCTTCDVHKTVIDATMHFSILQWLCPCLAVCCSACQSVIAITLKNSRNSWNWQRSRQETAD